MFSFERQKTMHLTCTIHTRNIEILNFEREIEKKNKKKVLLDKINKHSNR